MDSDITTLERAFQLAKSGGCRSVSDIKKRLQAEGYAVSQVEGSALRKQLMAIIKEATASPPEPTSE